MVSHCLNFRIVSCLCLETQSVGFCVGRRSDFERSQWSSFYEGRNDFKVKLNMLLVYLAFYFVLGFRLFHGHLLCKYILKILEGDFVLVVASIIVLFTEVIFFVIGLSDCFALVISVPSNHRHLLYCATHMLRNNCYFLFCLCIRSFHEYKIINFESCLLNIQIWILYSCILFDIDFWSWIWSAVNYFAVQPL